MSRCRFPTVIAVPLLVLGVLLAPEALGAAEPHAILSRGFEPDQVYDFNDIDHVNLFNGNLVVTIPIGQRYPVNGGFEYGFTLVYNSSIWEYVVDCPRNGKQEFGEGDPVILTDPAAADDGCLRGIPNPKSNAGTSWRLTLGELYDVFSPLFAGKGWVFIGPDGAERRFLPPTGEVDASYPQFTRDGSHLRLRQTNASATPACSGILGTCMAVDRPDGVVYAFEQIGGPVGWRLRRIQDPFGNWVEVDYSTPDTWRIRDSLNREHTIDFDPTHGMVTAVSMAAFGGQPALYDFEVADRPAVLPACPHNFDADQQSEREVLDQLTSVTLPDGSSYSFSYLPDDGFALCSRTSGRLESITLPTLGQIRYEYGGYQFPVSTCDPPPIRSGYVERNFVGQQGVTRRIAYNDDGSRLGERRYVNGGFQAAPTRRGFTTEQQKTCILPRTTYTDLYEEVEEGRYRLTRNFFSVSQAAAVTEPRTLNEHRRYGLPIDHLTTDQRHAERYRSSMEFACPSYPAPSLEYGPNCAVEPGAGCWPADAQHLQVPTSCYDVDKDGDTSDVFLAPEEVRGLRDTYLQHESGNVHYCDGSTSAECGFANWRVKSDLTYFYDSPGNYFVETERSGFDRFGHYRTTTSRSNSPGSVTRRVTVDYNPATVPWLLGLFDFREVVEGGARSTESYTFDRTTGFLEKKTTLRDAGSMVATFTNDGHGNVDTETYAGGDPGQASYLVKNGFQNGGLSRSEYMQGGASVLVTVDADIDANTGLPSASRDPAGLQTNYGFDELGRLTSVTQQGTYAEAATGYTYLPADPARTSGDTRASVTIVQADTSSQIFFDGLGRVNEEHTLLPGGITNRRFTSFTPQGQVDSVTTLHDKAAASSAQTTKTDYDIFGRPTQVEQPDGKKINFWYEGIFKRTRQIPKIQTPNGIEQMRTHYLHDHQGRLVEVQEMDVVSSPFSSTLERRTRYVYDEGGRLVRVDQGGGTQIRTFDYDEAGLLTKECHPELADGCILYSAFDARGNPATLRYSRDGGATFGLDYRYDAAERLTQVRQGGKLLKEFFYGTGSTGTNGRGKLYQSKRHNYLGSLDIVATVTNDYAGVGGRLSRRIVSTGGDGDVPRVRFTTDFAYDTLGNLAQVTYPGCEQVGCEAEAPFRRVDNTYTRGLLTDVGTATSAARYASLTYHPNLTVDEVWHTNGVRDDVTQDASQMPRPGAVEVRTGADPGLGTLWQATYGYDGAGNLVSRAGTGYDNGGNVLFSGTDLFRYDNAFNQLEEATIHYPSGTSGGIETRTYGYDPFGNLTGVTGSSPRTLTPDPATNRLQSPFSYDPAGNLTSQPGWDASGNPVAPAAWYYDYDAFNMMTRARSGSGSVSREYIYTADDERLAVLFGSRELWSLRGADARVLRDVEYLSTGWGWMKDYVHRGSGLLASHDTFGNERHYHLDHLGTPRLVTDINGQIQARHVHAPYGEELTWSGQDELRMKFTGHERDELDLSSAEGDLDYMHARYYSGNMGRFLSMDPGKDWDKEVSQSWNLYTYVRNNPLNLTDPTGRCTDPGGPGTRICIQAFIPSPTFGGFKGDNRGARSDGGTYRTNQSINVSSDEPRALLNHSFEPGVSRLGNLTREAVVADQDVVPTAEGLMVSAEASDGLLLGGAPNLEYDLTIAPGEGGELSVSGTHTAFPSLEVWVYEDGEKPQLIYLHEASADGFVEGMIDINLTVEVPE